MRPIQEALSLVSDRFGDGVNITSIEQIQGGMSNYNFKVRVAFDFEKVDYFVRIPTEMSGLFVDFANEMAAYKWITLSKDKLWELFASNMLSRYDGKQIRWFLADYEPLSQESYIDYRCLAKKIMALHKGGKPDDVITKDVFLNQPDRLKRYAEPSDFMAHAYNFIKKQYGLLEKHNVIPEEDITFCHGDLMPSNILYNKTTGNFKFIDLEFARVCDRIYDIACFGNVNDEEGLKLLKEYSKLYNDEGVIPYGELRYWYWRSFQTIQWYYVAMTKYYKSECYDSFNIDFKKYADECERKLIYELQMLDSEMSKLFNKDVNNK